jgi:hypothetical protein
VQSWRKGSKKRRTHDEGLKAYVRLKAAVSAALSGRLAALIHHNADAVPTNIVSISIDLLFTCGLMFILSGYFGRASLRRSKTMDILDSENQILTYSL